MIARINPNATTVPSYLNVFFNDSPITSELFALNWASSSFSLTNRYEFCCDKDSFPVSVCNPMEAFTRSFIQLHPTDEIKYIPNG